MTLACFYIKVSDEPRCKTFDLLAARAMLVKPQAGSYWAEGFADAIFLYYRAQNILLKESHEGALKETRFENLGCHPNKRQ